MGCTCWCWRAGREAEKGPSPEDSQRGMEREDRSQNQGWDAGGRGSMGDSALRVQRTRRPSRHPLPHEVQVGSYALETCTPSRRAHCAPGPGLVSQRQSPEDSAWTLWESCFPTCWAGDAHPTLGGNYYYLFHPHPRICSH